MGKLENDKILEANLAVDLLTHFHIIFFKEVYYELQNYYINI